MPALCRCKDVFAESNNHQPIFRSHLKIRIFGRDQGEAEDQPAGILKYVEDLIRGLNTDIERKDFFEMVSIMIDLVIDLAKLGG
jgi:hypothetical protein